MFKPLSLQRLTEHVEILVKTHGSGHKYSDYAGGGCQYHTGPKGTGCIIGESLFLAGLARDDLERLAGSCSSAAFYAAKFLGVELFEDEEVRAVAQKIQNMQDSNQTWGECLAFLWGYLGGRSGVFRTSN